jgi:multisubunit Na+/H+ antiporter MnhG subunit
MRFTFFLLAALIIGCCGGFAHIAFADKVGEPNLIYLVAIAGSLTFLFLGAIALHKMKDPSFSMVVAAETIVAYGIASLTGGVALGLTQALKMDWAASLVTPDHITRIATPFVEGILIAALAPLLAAALRNIDSASGGVISKPDSEGSIPELESRVKEIAQAVAGLNAEISKLSTTLINHIDQFEKAAKASTNAIEQVGSQLKEQTGFLRAALQETQAEIKGIGAAAGSSREALHGLGSQVTALNGSTEQATKLLDGLGRIIARFEGFISRDRKAA